MLTLKDLRRQALVLAIAGAVGIAGSAQAAKPNSGAQLATVSHATPLSRGDVVRGALALSHPIHITVALNLRNRAQLDAYNAKPHQPMSRAELAANYLPTSAQAQAVADFLKSAGFTNVRISASRMLVNADASAAVASRAFNTSFVQVRTHDGRIAFANTSAIQVPAALAGSVRAVLGAQTVHQAHTYAVKATTTGGIGGHLTPEFADIYGASGLGPATNVDVAIIGWGSMEQSVTDLGDFMTNNPGYSAGTVSVVCTDVGATIDPNTGMPSGGTTTIGDSTCGGNSDQGSVEWSMDSQSILGITGGVRSLTFYAAQSGNNFEITDAINEVVYPSQGEPLASVINQSYGECERFEDSTHTFVYSDGNTYSGDGTAQADDQLYAVGVAQGQTFSASTGDSGADECVKDGLAAALNNASYPASSPYNVAVAGTTLNASSTTWSRETEWVGSGGSPSSFEASPSWQTALTYGTFKGMRGPDVAFDANPNTGAIYYNGGSLIQVGGTSLASPLFVGAWARLIANGAVDPMTPAGQQLYAMPASFFHDITGGNNGGYITRRGWDWASGRGSLNLSNFSSQVTAAAIKR
ncbi:MAG TPA: S53 family peptidase [Rhodanobacteraceae bacterium]|nr:S53 family peptidase [Rhodanobacteraceae bacterium]